MIRTALIEQPSLGMPERPSAMQVSIGRFVSRIAGASLIALAKNRSFKDVDGRLYRFERVPSLP